MKLKHYIIMLFLPFLCFSSIINGQLKAGVIGGIDIASYSSSHKSMAVTLSSKPGFIIGGLLEFPLDKIIYLNIIPKYVQKGGNNTIYNLENLQNSITFSYLDLSTHFSLHLNKNRAIKKIYTEIIFGMSLGYLLNTSASNGQKTYDIAGDINSINLAGEGGLRFVYQFSESQSFFVNGVYSYGLINISQSQSNIGTKDIQFVFGCLYSLF